MNQQGDQELLSLQRIIERHGDELGGGLPALADGYAGGFWG